LSEAVRLSPAEGKLHYDLAVTLAVEGKTDDALRHYSKAVSIKPTLDKSPILHHFLATKYANEGQLRKAILSEEKALNLAIAAGDRQIALQIKERLEFYQQQEIRERMGHLR
jgi:tetratricopeptide (TPR) repeat protein